MPGSAHDHPSDAARLGQLLEVGPDATPALDLTAVLERLLETARELTGARYAAIGVLDDRGRSLEHFITAGIDPTLRETIGEPPRGHGILGLLIDRPEPVVLPSISDHARSYGFPAGHPPMTTFLGHPISIGDEVWGNVYLTEKAGGKQFTDDDLATVTVLARWAAVAIDNQRRLGAAANQRAALQSAMTALQAAIDITLAVGDDTDLPRTLQVIVARGRALVGADALMIWLMHGDELRLAAVDGAVSVSADAVLPTRSSTAGDALAMGRSVQPAEVDVGALAPARYGLPTGSATLIVPLLHRGRELGVLVAFGAPGGDDAFVEQSRRALEAFGVSAATSVAVSRGVEAQRLHDTLAAAESERQRWARELHDETLQGLAALKLSLAMALRAPGDQGWVMVEDAVHQLAGNIDDLRGIIADLRPAALDEFGLEPALRELARRAATASSLASRVEFELGDVRLPPDVELIAYRVAQEALTNVVKHARASQVLIRVEWLGTDRVSLMVVDDGCGSAGSPLGTRDPGHGYGVAGMRERAALGNGTLDLSPVPHGGTRVTLELPWAAA